MVVQELAKIGFSDLRNMVTDKGSLVDPNEWDDKTAAAIASIEVVTASGDRGKDEDGRKVVEHVHKIKMWDKNSALEKLAKHLGMYAPDKIEHTGKDGGPIETTGIAIYQLPDNGRSSTD
jgi:phage terminase small subunit